MMTEKRRGMTRRTNASGSWVKSLRSPMVSLPRILHQFAAEMNLGISTFPPGSGVPS
jgi:hypothetical protein